MEQTETRTTIELVVRCPGGVERNVAIELPREARVSQLATALARHLGLDDGGPLFLLRQSRWLEPDAAVADVRLVRGDVLSIGEAPEPAPDIPPLEGLELVAVGGPSIGSRWSLTGDRVVIGRSRDCDITVDDPAMSRVHLQVDLDGSAVRVTDRGSTNGTFIEGIPLAPGRLVTADDVVEAGSSLLKIQPASTGARSRDAGADGSIRFNRPPRVRPAPSGEAFVIPAPPTAAERPRLPLAAAAVPLLIALVLWRMFPDNPALLLIMALSPVLAVASYLEDRRRGSRHLGRQQTEWRAQLDQVINRLEQTRMEAARRLQASAPGASDLERRAEHVESSLWERRPQDDDFMLMRVGWGDRSWSPNLQREAGGSEALREEVEQRAAQALVLPSVPLTVSLRSPTVTGICGDRPAVDALTRWWLVQIATLHSPEDVSVVEVFGHDESASWMWSRWFPHARAQADSAATPLEQVVSAINSGRDRPSSLDTAGTTNTVVVIRGDAEAPASSLTRLLREGPAVGISVVWLGARPEDLPGECASIVEVASASGNVMVTFTDGAQQESGAAEGLDEPTARRVALALAPVREGRAAKRDSALAERLSLFDALQVEQPTADWVQQRWGSAAGGLPVTIGRDREGPVSLDLVADGPHALVAGTTGSGKSELLQTWVAALAAATPPDRLNLLLIDYKGGAAFKDLQRIPHTVGMVTDLDAHLAERALVSLNAELKRRERVLRDAGARDVAELEQGDAANAPPRLLLVIDEFATLVKELPAFVDGVVDLAQRGRSLGIHLVLATQRPAGVISDAVRANTNLRISLRVADEAESHDVVGVPDAAFISRRTPGRAYVRRGHAEVEEIQTAFGGSAATGAARAVEVRDLWVDEPPPVASDAHETQIQRVVDAVVAAGEAAGLRRASSPWLPPLPPVLDLADVATQEGGAVFGLLDEPHLQRQRPAVISLEEDGGCVIYGAAGSGKTTLLLTIGASFVSAQGAPGVVVYGLDFGGGALRALNELPNCGDVVSGDDQERVERLLFMIRAEVEHRRRLFAQTGVSNLAELVRSGREAPPRILVMLDEYGAFAAAFETVNLGEMIDLLPRLVSEGRSVGVHFAMTAARRASVPSALAASFGKKIVLRMGDPDDYIALGLDRRNLRGHTWGPGRGFIDGIEFQAATVGPDPAPEKVARALAALGEAARDVNLPRPPRVRLLPSSISIGELPRASEPWTATVGARETDLAEAHVELTEGHLLVAGPYRSGRSTALATMTAGVRTSTPEVALWLFAPRRTPLVELDLWARVARGGDACQEAVEELAMQLNAGEGGPLLVVIDDAEELAEGSASYALEPVVKKARDATVRFMVAAEARSLHRLFGGWLSEIRKDKRGILLDPDIDLDGDLFGTRLPRRQKRSFPPGRGYLVSRSALELVQVARIEGSGS
ncbi:MAG: FtsK/SpoIIIE domain-containing protein [Actinomycetota bacterium]|nr:FtsK/SpoIIIE domain-containing protein [Actinomycetota bacterium]